jgi:hypothetical protein
MCFPDKPLSKGLSRNFQYKRSYDAFESNILPILGQSTDGGSQELRLFSRKQRLAGKALREEGAAAPEFMSELKPPTP